ncbi:MAG: hypothetical protein IKH57_10020 [Clostridia bacterium]|nr:hypothetical protein [Clostridia bacterium]
MHFLFRFLLEDFAKTHTYTHTGPEKQSQKTGFPNRRRMAVTFNRQPSTNNNHVKVFHVKPTMTEIPGRTGVITITKAEKRGGVIEEIHPAGNNDESNLND